LYLHPIDIAIIVVYFAGIVWLGFFLSKKASKNLDAYFLGGNKIPWYYLGLSNASGMFDISGTMWTVSILFIYGLKSAWLPWLWPVWNQIFLMIFLAVWLRRSNVMTGAEWIRTRFGEGTGAHLSHIIVVVFAVITVIGFIAYGFEGIGKFSSIFFAYDLSFRFLGIDFTSEEAYGLIFMGITTLYVIKGGIYSVVGTEVIQFFIMTFSCIVIGIIAMFAISPDQVYAFVPEGWDEFFFGWRLDMDWSGIMDSVNYRIEQDGFELFGYALILMILKGIMVSIAGPVPSYDMQRVLATGTPKEAAKMSGLVILVLYFPRYFMVAGLTVLAIVFFSPELKSMGADIDFEMILPYAISNFVPIGFMGILLAGLIAAFMSTFAAFVNAAPAYIVNDIYKKYINPDASDRTYVRLSYAASLTVVVVGILFGFVVDTIHALTVWIVGGLYGGYIAANLLKWIWWRLNGYGYFWGMLAGIVAALTTPALFPDLTALFAFPIVFGFSLGGTIIGTLLTSPTEPQVLKKFYTEVRPWGWWKPVQEACIAENPAITPNTDFRRDMFNCATGIAWQMSLVVMPIYLVLGEYPKMGVSIAVFVLTSVILKFNWLDKIEDYPAGTELSEKDIRGRLKTEVKS